MLLAPSLKPDYLGLPLLIILNSYKLHLICLCLHFCRILWKKNEVADYEATTFSIFYNNALYLVLLIVISFYIVKNLNPTVYPLLLSLNWEWPLLVHRLNKKDGGCVCVCVCVRVGGIYEGWELHVYILYIYEGGVTCVSYVYI